MTNEKKLEILNRVEEKCYTVLDNLDGPDLMTTEADRLIQRIHDIGYLTSRTLDADTFVAKPNETEAEDEKSPERPAEAVEKSPAETVEQGYSKEEVKKILVNLQTTAGVDIATVMSSMGYAKLSDVPEEEYFDLVKTAQRAAKKEG